MREEYPDNFDRDLYFSQHTKFFEALVFDEDLGELDYWLGNGSSSEHFASTIPEKLEILRVREIK